MLVVNERRHEYGRHNSKICPISHLKSLAVGTRIENVQELCILLRDILRGFYLRRVKFEILIRVFLAYFVMEIRQNPFLPLSYFYLPSFYSSFFFCIYSNIILAFSYFRFSVFSFYILLPWKPRLHVSFV